MMRDSSAFEAGVYIEIKNVENCDDCEVTRAQPAFDNEVIFDLYFLLPDNFDGFTGFKIITLSDIIELFKMFDVHQDLWDDYYMRLMYFHEALITKKSKYLESKQKDTDSSLVKNSGE